VRRIYDLAATIRAPVMVPLNMYFPTRLVGGGATVEGRDLKTGPPLESLAKRAEGPRARPTDAEFAIA